MSDVAAEEPEPVFSNFVVNGSEIQHGYPIGFLPANVEGGPLIQIIFITEIDNKVLVCVCVFLFQHGIASLRAMY